jgi:hypothetical protein
MVTERRTSTGVTLMEQREEESRDTGNERRFVSAIQPAISFAFDHFHQQVLSEPKEHGRESREESIEGLYKESKEARHSIWTDQTS